MNNIVVKKLSSIALFMVLAAAVVFLFDVQEAEAVNCSPTEMSSCLPAIIYGNPPSSTCCSKVKKQKPCVCGYIKDPNLRNSANSPNAEAVVSKCGVPYPKC